MDASGQAGVDTGGIMRANANAHPVWMHMHLARQNCLTAAWCHADCIDATQVLGLVTQVVPATRTCCQMRIHNWIMLEGTHHVMQ